MNVEFDAPEGYVESTRTTGSQPATTDPHILELPPAVRALLAVDTFTPFSAGRRLVYRSTVQQPMPVHIRRCDSGDNRGIFSLFLK